MTSQASVFDYDKLTWFNGEYIRAMAPEKFTEMAMPYYKSVFGETEANWEVLSAILQPRVTKFTEIPELIGFFKDLPEYDNEIFVNKKSKTNLKTTKKSPLMY